jgi:hypothetical protein
VRGGPGMPGRLRGGPSVKKASFLSVLAAAALPFALAGPPAAAAEQDAETRSEVQALTDLHEVVVPLWHEAWPKKNYQMMKDLLPQARAGVAKVAEARLPGILREKQAAWDQGLVGLKEALARYEAAAASGSEPGLLDAVEALHSRYEGLVRVTRPAMKELDAFHVALYRVYHHELAGQAWPAVAASAGEMAEACRALAAAPVPKRFASQEASLRPEIATLCAKSDALKAAAAGTDRKATAEAVESVHSQYEKVEGLFR